MSQGVLAADSPAATARERIRVPLLAQTIAERATSGRQVWLDLGHVQPGLLPLLQRGRTRLLVADLAAGRAAGCADWHLPDAALSGTGAGPGEHIDCVLCWDLLNYLAPDEMGELAARLAGNADPDCVVHALIQYSGREMPDRPLRLRVVESAELEIEPEPDAVMIPSPRYSPKGLEKAMPELVVDRTMLLNNGMQEFLFRLRPPHGR
ncbi:MAG: hypothetical protein RQ847_02380 [Wenzhouxiangellaceae bacterium]|nr:hypothetical protein [Wenzhouxiangellaceae bacterium]